MASKNFQRKLSFESVNNNSFVPVLDRKKLLSAPKFKKTVAEEYEVADTSEKKTEIVNNFIKETQKLLKKNQKKMEKIKKKRSKKKNIYPTFETDDEGYAGDDDLIKIEGGRKSYFKKKRTKKKKRRRTKKRK